MSAVRDVFPAGNYGEGVLTFRSGEQAWCVWSRRGDVIDVRYESGCSFEHRPDGTRAPYMITYVAADLSRTEERIENPDQRRDVVDVAPMPWDQAQRLGVKYGCTP